MLGAAEDPPGAQARQDRERHARQDVETLDHALSEVVGVRRARVGLEDRARDEERREERDSLRSPVPPRPPEPGGREQDPRVHEAVCEGRRQEPQALPGGAALPAGDERRGAVVPARHLGHEPAEARRVAPVHHRSRGGCEREVEVGQETGDECAEGDSQVSERETKCSGVARQQGPALPCEHEERRDEQEDRLLIADREPEQEHEQPDEPRPAGLPAPLDPDQEQDGGEEVVEGEDLGHHGVGPEKARESEEQRAGGRRHDGHPAPGSGVRAGRDQPVDGHERDPHGERIEERREEVHPERGRSARKMRDEVPEQGVERVPGRMGNAENIGGTDELAGVPRRDRRLDREGVDGEGNERCDARRDEPGAVEARNGPRFGRRRSRRPRVRLLARPERRGCIGDRDPGDGPGLPRSIPAAHARMVAQARPARCSCA